MTSFDVVWFVVGTSLLIYLFFALLKRVWFA